MAFMYFIVFTLFISACFGAATNKVCLYSGQQVLEPLTLTHTNCPSNFTYCMNQLYKYGNWQYGGPASLKPGRGEIVMFLSQDAEGRLDFVTLLNANMDTTMSVYVEVTGALPTNILLYDDPAPSDTWAWNPATNSGNFSWTTLPTYTDGVIIGHINFTDNYCLRSIYNQPNRAIQNISIMTGTVAAPQRIVTQNFTSGAAFQFCQYPVTATQYNNVSCPGLSDGAATISIIYGPSTFDYTWTNSAGTVIGTSATISNVRAGTYRVHVNANGCAADRTVTISEPQLVGAKITTTPYACVTKGSASAVGAGGVGTYSFQWYKQAVLLGTGSSVSNLDIGSYSVCVTDGCGNRTCQTFNIVSSGCCGDATCNATLGENCVTCQADCTVKPCGVCGDGTCDGAETCFSCEADCGKCCVPGTYKSGSSCVVCPPGSTSTTYQATQCDDCPANTYSPGGNVSCTPCPANQFSAAGSGKCKSCDVGKVRDNGEASCHTCSGGYLAPPCGESSCSSCLPGTYSAGSSWTCLPCAPGTYQPNSAQTSCLDCPAGTYSAAKAATCTSCPSGLSSPSGSTHVVACA